MTQEKGDLMWQRIVELEQENLKLKERMIPNEDECSIVARRICKEVGSTAVTTQFAAEKATRLFYEWLVVKLK